MKAGEAEYKRALTLAKKKSPDLDEVRQLLEKAIVKKNAEAMYALATWFLHGKHVKRNYSKAVDLLIPAAKGVASASSDLAVCYERGKGVKKNLSKALLYYTNAALLGDSQAHYEVGRCYYYGIGTRKDPDTAEIWLSSAERLGIK